MKRVKTRVEVHIKYMEGEIEIPIQEQTIQSSSAFALRDAAEHQCDHSGTEGGRSLVHQAFQFHIEIRGGLPVPSARSCRI
jgi:hypothetical protein